MQYYYWMQFWTNLFLANLAALVPATAFLAHPPPSATGTSLNMAGDEFAFKTTSAAEKYSGGPITVDLNVYNLNLEDAADEWTATLVASSATKPDGVHLEAKSNALVYVETLTYIVQRQAGEGLGLELLELAGGRDDGVGITVVSGLVEGSVSEGCGLVPGDSIVKMTVVTGAMELESASVGLECCS